MQSIKQNPDRRQSPVPVALTTADNVELQGYVYEPAAEAWVTAVVTGGVGVPQRIYRPLVEWLARKGIRCLCFDYRGCGESRHSEKARASASLTNWAQRDAVAAYDYAMKTWEEPVVLLAHSFGGQLLSLAEPLRGVRSAVLIASQCGNARYWDGLLQLKVAALWYLILPVLTVFYRTTPRWLGFRLPRGVAREWARWGRQRDWLFSKYADANDRLARFDKPVLAFSIEDDELAPPRAAQAFLQRFDTAVLSSHRLVPATFETDCIGHYGVFQNGRLAGVWEEIHAFFASTALHPVPRSAT